MKKILIFATYTITEPQHGGQKRVRAMYEAYNNDPELESKFCAIYFPLHYKDKWSEDIAIPRQHSSLMANNPLTGDVITGRLVRDDKSLRKKVIKKITDYNPDIIEIVQPFLYIGLKSILEEINFQGKIIFSSQNIEYPMKKEMLENESFNPEMIEQFVNEIETVEKELAKDADLVIGVSEEDNESLIKLGADERKVILARNGIDKQKADSEMLKYWYEYFNKIGVKKIALFVGSAHPPNWTGFQKMIGSKIGFLNRDERIVLAGSIGEYFEKHYIHGAMEEVLFWKRIASVGRLPEKKLTGLIEHANCLLLPIVEGGGSNLKTAEALLSQKTVVGTSHAFRSFESFLSYPTVHISDSPIEFRRNIATSLRSGTVRLTEKQKKGLDLVTWDYCLRAAIERIKKL